MARLRVIGAMATRWANRMRPSRVGDHSAAVSVSVSVVVAVGVVAVVMSETVIPG